MQSTRSASRAAAATGSGSALRVEGDTGLQPMLVSCANREGDVVDRLEVERHTVSARGSDRFEVFRRALDHQMHVDDPIRVVDQRRDRLQHDRAHRDRLDEVAVADVEVEDAATGGEQLVDLGAELREIRTVEGRFDFDRPDPVAPGQRF